MLTNMVSTSHSSDSIKWNRPDYGRTGISPIELTVQLMNRMNPLVLFEPNGSTNFFYFFLSIKMTSFWWLLKYLFYPLPPTNSPSQHPSSSSSCQRLRLPCPHSKILFPPSPNSFTCRLNFHFYFIFLNLIFMFYI